MTPEEIAAADAAKKKAPAAKAKAAPKAKEAAQPKGTEKPVGGEVAGNASGEARKPTDPPAPAAKAGPAVLAEVNYNGKLYQPGGKPLPGDVPEKTLGRLKARGFI